MSPRKAATDRPRDPRAASAQSTTPRIAIPKPSDRTPIITIKDEPPEYGQNIAPGYESSDSDGEDFADWDGFEVSRALPRYDERRYTLRELMMLLDTPNGIDLDPIYQRGFVWNEDRQIGLVDSIFQGYYIPGLIFNKQQRQIGSIQRSIMVCIDGKQRLTSVKRFTEGHFPCHDRFGSKWFFCRPWDAEKQPHGRKHLPPTAKAAFWQKTFLCYEYVGMTDDQEHELFERVQRGNPLTPAEKSQAKKGPWQELARRFEQDYFRVMRLGGNARGAGHGKIISSFIQIREQDRAAVDPLRPEHFKATNYWVDKWFVADVHQHPCTPEIADRMKGIFDRFERIARSKRAFANDGLSNERAKVAPIEFVAIACMIDRYSHKTDAELEETIRYMRREVRKSHSNDVQRKPAVWRTLCAAIEKSLEQKEEMQIDDHEDDRDEADIRYEQPVLSALGASYGESERYFDDSYDDDEAAAKMLRYWQSVAEKDRKAKDPESPANAHGDLKRTSKADNQGRNVRQRYS